jgi:hypothetical protein
MALGLTSAASAQEYRPVQRFAPGDLTISTARRTAFDPPLHGLKFGNAFANNAVPELDIKTDGLCGGMVYTALDYFNNRSVPLPTQSYMPAEGSAFRRYIYDRQMESMTSNADKWGELMFNPFGARNGEFYRWGLQPTGGRLDELRRSIDAGIPAPLGLRGCDEGCKPDHQVLAIGYDLGNYNGDPYSATSRAVRIFLYDPNFPNQTMTLTPFREVEQFQYVEDNRIRWRTWFVNANYRPRRPPLVTQPRREVILSLRIGIDDLRGGGTDNLTVIVLFRGGRLLRFENVNGGRQWVGNGWQDVALPMPDDAPPLDQLMGVTLATTFGGGERGENWNLDAIEVRTQDGGVERQRLYISHGGEREPPTPLFRFTAARRSKVFLFR